MKYRELGDTGIRVSEIGFGTWGIGSNAKGAIAYGKTNDLDSIAALRCAYEAGINFYDTADFYGYGHSEELIGKALGDVRQDIVIASKVGMISVDGKQDFSVAHINKTIEESLLRLKTDYIDLYQLHSPSIEDIEKNDDIVCEMQRLQEDGKILEYGISLRSPEDGDAAITRLGFKVVQVNFNLIDQRVVENGFLELCKERGVGVVVRTPLCFGFLSGVYSANSKFTSDDHRSKWSPEQISTWANAYRSFIMRIIENEDQTNAQFALRFCLSYSGISTVIPGMLNVDEVKENALASAMGVLSPEEVNNMEQEYKNNSFFVQ